LLALGKRNSKQQAHVSCGDAETRREGEGKRLQGKRLFNHGIHTTEAKLGGDDAKRRPKGETSERMRIKTHKEDPTAWRGEGTSPSPSAPRVEQASCLLVLMQAV